MPSPLTPCRVGTAIFRASSARDEPHGFGALTLKAATRLRPRHGRPARHRSSAALCTPDAGPGCAGVDCRVCLVERAGDRKPAYTYYVVRALHSAAGKRFTLMGWLDDRWREAEGSADELERRLLEAAVRRDR